MTLGARNTRSLPFLNIVEKNDTYGLGYTPTIGDAKETRKKQVAKRMNTEMMIRPYPHTLNGQFITQGDVYPYYEFPEPFTGIDGMRYLGIEIFSDCNFLNEGVTAPKSALDSFDTDGLGMLFGQETNSPTKEEVYMATNGNSFDPTEMIVPANPITHRWRKTVKVTPPKGKTMSFTMGEGPMFDESSSESSI